ncbi:MAG: M20 family metallo-hydrolase [Bacteroidaceae bacterium]|nr:M20 family metallo-hydrolase [Bacteroidaceae bacterium]
MNSNSKTTEAIALLKHLIVTPSLSRNESAVADILCDYLSDKGYSPERKGNNVWTRSHNWDETLPIVLLDAHIDTVKPSAGWTHEPFVADEVEGRIFGLGANDDGGSLVSLLHAFLAWDEAEGVSRKWNLIFLASAEEEVSGKEGIESVIPELPEISFCICGEPTGMQPAVSEKGLMVIDVTEEGRAGHAARNEGVNALYKAMDDIQWIRNHKFERVSDTLGEVKATVTIIQAGTLHNVIPASCQFTIDVRSNDLYTNDELFTEINSALEGRCKARSYRLGSSHTDLSHPIVRRMIDEMGMQPFGSPTLSNQALMPFPSVKIGPGESSRSHGADEYIEIAEIDRAINLYLQILQ